MTYLHSDHLGSVSVVTDAGGNLASKQEFDPWGNLRSGGITSTSLNYTGQRRDDTGLLYYNARYYDPQIGRFVSADTVVPGNASGGMDGVALRPLTVDFHEGGLLAGLASEGARADTLDWGGPSDPQGLNRYAYVENNPLRWTDPSGHCFEVISCTIEGAAAGSIVPGPGTAVGAGIGFVIGVVIVISIGAGTAYVASEVVKSANAGDTTAKAADTVLESRRYAGDKRSAEKIINSDKKGNIRSRFPKEWLGKTPDEIYKEAEKGTKSAQTAKKLLDSNEYDKDEKR